MLLEMNVKMLGQVFTPVSIVQLMLSLRRRSGRVLEPSCGDGAFSNLIPDCVAIELDSANAPRHALVMDFFDFPLSETFETIIGNPPYVRFQDIAPKQNRNSRLRASTLAQTFISSSLKNALSTLHRQAN